MEFPNVSSEALAFDEDLKKRARDVGLPVDPDPFAGYPNPEAARAREGVNVLGKILGSIGIDESGRRAETSWSDALDNTANSLSVVNFLEDIVRAGKDASETLPYYGIEDVQDEARNRLTGSSMVLGGAAATGSLLAPRPKGSVGMFGGRLAKNADTDALAKAEDMAAKGASRDEIWNETGWFKGVDGKWRFEIDDSQAGWNPGIYGSGLDAPSALEVHKAAHGKNPMLSEYLSHERALDAYPGMGKLSVKPVDNKFGNLETRGFLDGPTMSLNTAYGGKDMLSTVLHEGQHAIQIGEGFAKGGSPGTFKNQRARLEKKIKEDNSRLSMWAKRIRTAGTEDAKKQARNEYEKVMERKMAAVSKLQSIDDEYGLPGVGAYKRLAGEVEARNVQARQNMTPEERRATPPWKTQDVPDEDQIVSFEAGKAQASIQTGRDKLGFTSKALEAAHALKQDRGTPEQMLSQLKKSGVKDAEIEATNLQDFLAGSNSVTKQDIIKHLEDNRVEVREAVKGDYVGEFERLLARDPNNPRIEEMRSQGLMNESHGTKYQDWSLSKNKNDPTYKETVVHLRSRDKIPGSDETRNLLMDDDLAEIDSNFETNVDFRSGHWSEPNIIAHYRSQHLKTDKGETSLNIDELQSDWGQKLREGGARDEAKIAELKERVKGVDREIEAIGKEWDARHKADPNIQHIRDTPDLKKRQDEAFLLQAELRTAEAATHGNPLVNTTDQWVNVGLKKVITDAVNQGVDGITITPGKVQAERYNVSKVVPRIRVQDEGDVRFVFPEDKQGNPIGRLDVTQDGAISFAEGASVLTEAKGKQLTDVFGANVAKEILGARHRTILDVGEIEIGGEGMKYAYDTMYPKKLTKLLQKIDKSIKPERRTVDGVGEMIYFPLTNKVKKKISNEGQPLFANPKTGPLAAEALTPDQPQMSEDDFNAWLESQANGVGIRSIEVPKRVESYLERAVQ